jgi:5,10-methylenetetrahydromethanopterin reductase
VPSAIRDIRRLLSGDPITYGDESIALTVARQCYPRALPQTVGQVPIYVGAKGPKMTRVAGRIGDGLLLGASTRMDELERQLGDLAAGARDAGRAVAEIDVASIIVTSVSSDGAIDPNTIGAVAARISRLNDTEIETLELDPSLVSRVRSAYLAGDCDALRGLISVDVATRWAAAGTPDQCLAVIGRQLGRGVTLPILFTFGCNVNDLLDLGARLAAGDN